MQALTSIYKVLTATQPMLLQLLIFVLPSCCICSLSVVTLSVTLMWNQLLVETKPVLTEHGAML